MNKNRKDITGQRFGKLVAIKPVGVSKFQTVIWMFKCECGGEASKVITLARRTGHCGCLTRSRLKAGSIRHGHAYTQSYKAWCSMRYRCENPKNDAYKFYGLRGISVCERWQEYKNFLEDMGKRPDGATIERINNDGNYEPSNCRWATRKEQMQNLSCSVKLTWNGITKCLSSWAQSLGINRETIRGRLKRGYSIEECFTVPLHTKFKNSQTYAH